jgi:phospholipid/cholesterol/gamma-HCH transport system substrate-binding protein
MALRSKGAGITRVLAAVAVLAVVAALGLAMIPQDDSKTLTASFPRTVSLYEGSDVRILGVPVGTVESVTPSGTDVTVRMTYDAKYDLPANAKAVIVSPAIVGDRFVQLTPVYTKGKKLPDGATLDARSTATPLELDEIYQSIDDLVVALGPDGANSEGALTNLLDSTATNFAGQGEQFHRTIDNLGKFTGTLENNKEELFGTARELERFVSVLAKNDQTVRRFNDSLAGAADLLEDEREDLAAALRNLGVAMRAVSSFVKENRDGLSENIEGLNRVSKILVKQRAALDETLAVAPTALSNLFHTYNPKTGTLDTRTNIGENIADLQSNPAMVLCSILAQTPAPKESCDLARQALPRAGALGSAGSAGSAGSSKAARVEHVERVDRSLAGIVEVEDR